MTFKLSNDATIKVNFKLRDKVKEDCRRNCQPRLGGDDSWGATPSVSATKREVHKDRVNS